MSNVKYLSYEGLTHYTENLFKVIEENEEVIASALTDLNTKLDTHTHTQYAPASHTHNYSPTSHSHSNATTTAAGFMSGVDKKKLDGLATVAMTGSYNDLSNKPTIPTVNNGTLTIKQNGTATLGTFTANQSTNATIDFIETQPNWNETTTTSPAYIRNKPNLAAVATSGSYTDLSNKPTLTTLGAAPTSHTHNNYLSTSGGTVNGSIKPGKSNSYYLGDSNYKWYAVYASKFYGDLSGNASSATNASNIYINTNTGSSYYPMTFVTTTSAGNTKLYIGGSTGTTSTGNGIRYNPSAKTCYCSGGFYEASDERLKNFGNDIEVDLDKLSKLSKKYFTWKDDESNAQHIGVSAQEVQAIYPELVEVIDEEGHLSVSYDKLSVVALKGIDVLNDKVKSLEERLERLEKLIDNK